MFLFVGTLPLDSTTAEFQTNCFVFGSIYKMTARPTKISSSAGTRHRKQTYLSSLKTTLMRNVIRSIKVLTLRKQSTVQGGYDELSQVIIWRQSPIQTAIYQETLGRLISHRMTGMSPLLQGSEELMWYSQINSTPCSIDCHSITFESPQPQRVLLNDSSHPITMICPKCRVNGLRKIICNLAQSSAFPATP
jgi:hypothetical protein